MKRLAAALLATVATFAVLAPISANAVATQTTGALSSTSWTDLGTGPMRLFGGGHTRYAISDSTPATVALGFEVGDTPTDVNTTSHVWVISADPNHGAFATYAPITAGGGGGGGGAATIADGADVAEGTTTDTSTVNTLIGLSKAIKASVANIGAAPMQATGGVVTANSPVNQTVTQCAGSITTGGTAQVAIAAQTTLHQFTITNNDATHGSGEPLWISLTTTATMAGGSGSDPLAAPTVTTMAGMGSTTIINGTNHAISIIGATTGHTYGCFWS